MKKNSLTNFFISIAVLILFFTFITAYKIGASAQKELTIPRTKINSLSPKLESSIKTFLITISEDKKNVNYYNGNGFSFTFPSKYSISTNESWPHAVILLMQQGSTAYDLSVEVANSKEELYELGTSQSDILKGYGLMKQKENLYVVFGNPNKNPEIAKIIESFRFEE